MATPPPDARARARSASQSPGRGGVQALPPMPAPPMPDVPDDAIGSEGPEGHHVPQRRGSFGFLKRGKSVERVNSKRSTSGGNKLTKRAVKERELQLQREAALLPKEPPQIPGLWSAPPLQSFDGAGGSPAHGAAAEGRDVDQSRDGKSTPYGVPIPPIPATRKGPYPDPNDRTGSMANRGRSSYASSTISTINSPRRVRKRNDPTPFNVLVIGTRNSGKTSFINFLCTSLAPPPRRGTVRQVEPPVQVANSSFASGFVSHCFETELADGETIALTIWDSEGVQKNVADLQMREISSFVESKFEETLREEIKVVRAPGVRDTHIHAVFLLLDPTRLDTNIAIAQKTREKSSNGNFANGHSYIHPPSPIGLDIGSLDEALDLPILKTLQGKTTVIPVISKADTIPQEHVLELRRSVGESLKQANLDPLENLGLDAEDDDDDDDDDDVSSDESEPAARPKLQNTSRKRAPDDSAIDDTEDISNQSMLNLSSSSDSGASSATSVARGPTGKATKPAVLFLPHTTLSPYPILAHEPGPGHVGRRFAWGSADPYNPEHCDFVKLKDAVFNEWRTELREAAKELWYENWRTSRLDHTGVPIPRRDLAGAPTTGRGARMGAQMVGANVKDADRRSGASPAGAAREPDRRTGQSPADWPQQRMGQSPARMPRDQQRTGHSPAGGHRAGYSPARVPREPQRMGRSPADGQRMGPPPADTRRDRSPLARHPMDDGNPYRKPPAGAYGAGPQSPPMAGPPPAGPLPGVPGGDRRAITAEERSKQVPWPLQ